MKVSGRRDAGGRSVPIKQRQGAMTRTPSDDKPQPLRREAEPEGGEAEKIEAQQKLPASRDSVKPIGHTRKPRRKTA